MSKLIFYLSLITIAFSVCKGAVALGRFSNLRSGNGFLSRLELSPVTPYPSADELKPEIAFDAEETPEDEVETEVRTETEVEPELDVPNAPRIPDQTYGPPEFGPSTSNAEPPAVEDDAELVDQQLENNVEEIDTDTEVFSTNELQRLTLRREKATRKFSQTLKAAPVAKPLARLEQPLLAIPTSQHPFYFYQF